MINITKQKIEKIEDSKLYKTEDILALGLIVNTKLEPSLFTIYRLINSGKLKAVDMSTGLQKRYFVKGKDLKSFLKKRYNY